MIVLELIWAAAIAGVVYYSIQQAIEQIGKDRAEKAHQKAAEAESKPLREEPPWGSN